MVAWGRREADREGEKGLFQFCTQSFEERSSEEVERTKTKC